MTLFEGAGVALVTPFKENSEVNYEKLEEIVGEQIVGGTDAIIAYGTTGEASIMTHEGHLEVTKYVCMATKKWIPVTAGTDSSCTGTAVYLSAGTEKRGADGLFLVSSYYNKATQKGLMARFTAVADAVKIPVILYNVPGRTGATIKPETIATLCKDVDNIMEVKEVSGNFPAIATLMSLSDSKVDLYSGNDDQIVPLLSLGGKSIISVLSNTAPCQTHDICASYFAGDTKTSASLQLKAIPLIAGLFSEVNPIPAKAVVNVMGRGVGPLYMPLTEMEPQNQGKLKKAMAGYGIPQGRLWERMVYQ